MARTLDNFEQWIEDFQKLILSSAENAVQKTAIEGANLIRGRVPGTRRKTRTAARARRITHNEAEVGLFFVEVYPTTATTTSRVIFRQEWERARPLLLDRMVTRLNEMFQ